MDDGELQSQEGQCLEEKIRSGNQLNSNRGSSSFDIPQTNRYIIPQQKAAITIIDLHHHHLNHDQHHHCSHHQDIWRYQVAEEIFPPELIKRHIKKEVGKDKY